MKIRIYLCQLLLLNCVAAVAQQVLPGGWITNGPVYAVSQNSQNTYVGGYFDLVGVHRPNGVTFDTNSGEPSSATDFPNKLVSSSAADGEGGFFIAGTESASNRYPSFSRVGQSQRDGLAHILPNGQVSLTFNPVFPGPRTWGKVVLTADNERVIVFAKSVNPATNLLVGRLYAFSHDGVILWERAVNNNAYGSSNNADVYAAVVYNSILYFSGKFTSIEGQPRARLAAIDVTSGNVLPWNTSALMPAIVNNTRRPISMGISGNELFLRVHATGTGSGIYGFDLLTGASTYTLLGLFGGPMVVHQGRMYYNNGFSLVIRDAVTKAVLPSPTQIQWNVPINSLAASDGKIYVASANGFMDGNANALGSIVSFDENSLALEPISSRIYLGVASPSILTLSASGNKLFAGGSFASIGMEPASQLFAYNSVSGERVAFAPTFNGTVTHLAAFEDRLYVNGYYWMANGTSADYGLSAFNLASGARTDWSPPAHVTSFSKFNNTLYASGEIPGRNGVAAFNASTGEMTDWNPPGNAFAFYCVADASGVYTSSSDIRFYDHATGNELHPPVMLSPFPSVQAMTVANNRLFIAGDLSSLSVGAVQVNNSTLGVIDLATGLPLPIQTDFDSQGWGVVNSLASDGGSVYLGGYFHQINGVSRNKTAAINAETLELSDWTVPIEPTSIPINSDHIVNFIGAFSEGIYIGGEFYQAKDLRVRNLALAQPDRTNVVEGTVFLDGDADGIRDAGEPGIPNLLIEVQPGNLFYPTDANGHYRFYTGIGEYTLSVVQPQYALSVNPGTLQLSFLDDLQQTSGVDFAIVPAPAVVDDYVEIISDRNPKPGFEYVYTVSYHNGGTQASSGTVSITLDPRLLNEGTVPAPTIIAGNMLEWSYTDLPVGANGSITINARVPAPTVEGSLMGEDLVTTAMLATESVDVDPSNNTSTLTETVVGAVDPNDKLVTPQGYGPYGYIDEDTEHLTYTIRFQNVGDAEAENIYIEDALHANLDESSLTMIESSHPNVEYYISNRRLYVTYPNINLADSVHNEPESHGFFTFRINMNSGLQRGDVIQNSASIIFDYNLPLETNTVTNTLRDAPYPVMIFIPDSIATIGSEISMPVLVNNFEGVMGMQLSISWDPLILSYSQIEHFNLPGLDENSFNIDNVSEGYMTLLWTEPGLVLQNRDDSTALFTIRFVANGDAGSTTDVNINQNPIAIEVVGEDYQLLEVERINGSVEIDNTVELAGSVVYPSDEGVANVSIDVSGSEIASTQTNAAGEFYFAVHPLNDQALYVVTPSKTDDPDLSNGIDVQDVARIRRHILDIEPFADPYMTIASDISNNHHVSVQDILILQGFILRINATFPNERHWTFIDADHTFTSALNPFPYPQTREVNLDALVEDANQHFIAVKMGDINFSRDNAQSGRQKQQEVIIEISAPEDLENDIVEVDLKTFGFVDIAAMQFTVSWNADELEWIEPQEYEIKFRYGAQHLNEGMVSAIWDDLDGKSIGLNDQSDLLTLRFKKKTDQTVSRVTLNGLITPQKMFDGELNPVSLITREGNAESVKTGTFYPNPFSSTTTIAFSATQSEVAEFQVTDTMGKAIDNKGLSVQKGWNEITYDGNNLKPGAYLIHIRLHDKRISAKVIKKQN